MIFYLRKYRPIKSNDKIHNKELLIMIHYLKAWDTKLRSVSKRFDIITNHKNIEYFVKKQYLNKR